MGKYGKTRSDGSVEVEPNECILTGRYVDPGNSVSERVKDTPYFWRVVGGQYDRVTDEDRARWRDEIVAHFESVSFAPLLTVDVPAEIVLESPTEVRRRSKSLGENE